MSQDKLDYLEGDLLRLRGVHKEQLAANDTKRAYKTWVRIRSHEVDIEIMKFRINKYQNAAQ